MVILQVRVSSVDQVVHQHITIVLIITPGFQKSRTLVLKSLMDHLEEEWFHNIDRSFQHLL